MFQVSTISKMLFDLLFFVSIISIFIAAFGVSTEGIIYPFGKEDGFWNIAWRPYIHLFGELDLDTLDNQLSVGYCKLRMKLTNASSSEDDLEECNNNDIYSCDEHLPCQYARIIVQIGLAIYMMLASVLMLNLLIAVFSKTYEGMTIENRDNLLWKWQRYDLMVEFKQRSAVPFPFSWLAYFLRLLRWFWRRCCSCGGKDFFERREAQKKNDEFKKAQISLLERECLRNILKNDQTEAEKQAQNEILYVLTIVSPINNLFIPTLLIKLGSLNLVIPCRSKFSILLEIV